MAGLLVMTFRQPSHPALISLFRPPTETSDNMTIIPLLEGPSRQPVSVSDTLYCTYSVIHTASKKGFLRIVAIVRGW